MKKRSILGNILVAGLILSIVIALGVIINRLVMESIFDGRQAYADDQTQLVFGARVPGSIAHQQTGDWILTELKDAGWQTLEQTAQVDGHTIRNLVGKRGSGTPWYILGAHYDSRLKADQDPVVALRDRSVPGANDGASGVAVLLELASALPEDLSGQVWLVFFDAEDQGNLAGWDWILGSSYFADHLAGTPDGVVVIDMIGDSNLGIYKERNSDPIMTEEIWLTASKAGFNKQFLPTFKYQMLDDHIPFLERGIPAVLLIDFNYPYWHTTADTLDKISAASLDKVGTILYRWLIEKLKYK